MDGVFWGTLGDTLTALEADASVHGIIFSSGETCLRREELRVFYLTCRTWVSEDREARTSFPRSAYLVMAIPCGGNCISFFSLCDASHASPAPLRQVNHSTREARKLAFPAREGHTFSAAASSSACGTSASTSPSFNASCALGMAAVVSSLCAVPWPICAAITRAQYLRAHARRVDWS
jgi:hypothetical protein